MEVGKRKRRRKTADERKESLVKVLLTEEQKRQFTAAADAAGMTISTWFRSLALAAAAKGNDREGGAK